MEKAGCVRQSRSQLPHCKRAVALGVEETPRKPDADILRWPGVMFVRKRLGIIATIVTVNVRIVIAPGAVADRGVVTTIGNILADECRGGGTQNPKASP